MGYYDAKPEDEPSYKFTEKLSSSVKVGDFLLLQDRPCQVIKITPGSGTGQSKYLGMDLISRNLCEDSSFTSASGSEQAVRGLDLVTWPILDIAEGACTVTDEADNTKGGVKVVERGDLISRIESRLRSGRGGLYGFVLQDGGKDLIVEMKIESKGGN